MRNLTLTILIALSTIITTETFAQGGEEVWDISYTELLIAQNKTNHSDNVDAKQNQLLLQATTLLWKDQEKKMREWVDKIDNGLTQMKIILNDVALVYDLYQVVDDIVDIQKETYTLTKKYPWSIPVVYDVQKGIFKDATETLGYIVIIVSSYGSINKLKNASRKKITSNLVFEMRSLRAKCLTLLTMMQQLDLAEILKNAPAFKMVNDDKKIIGDILKTFK